MKLSSKAIEAINNRPVIMSLALTLGFSELWVNKLIEANKPNGPLTTVAALEVIRKETELSDKEILEREPEEEPQSN